MILRILNALLLLPLCAIVAAASGIQVAIPALVHQGSEFAVHLNLAAYYEGTRTAIPKNVDVKIWLVSYNATAGIEQEQLLTKQKISTVRSLQCEIDGLVLTRIGKAKLKIEASGGLRATASTTCLPGWVSILPPVVTLLLSVLLKQVIVALLVGIFTGALLLTNGDALKAFLRTFDTYFVNAFVVDGHASVLLFTFLLGGAIGLVQKSGGALGLANSLKRHINNRLRGQLCSCALSSLLFFDDYSSILIVGNSLNTVVKGVKVSAEKFAWLVHTLGVVFASMSPISSWVGLQIGYTAGVLDGLGLTGKLDAFLLILYSMPYRFFPVFYLIFIVTTLVTGKDLGSMADRESKAVTSAADKGPSISAKGTDAPADDTVAGEPAGPLDPEAGTPLRSYNAVIPFGVVIVVTVVGMALDGIGKIHEKGDLVPVTVVNVLSHCDSVAALIWASSAGWMAAMVLVVAQGLLSLSQAMETWMQGTKEVLEPQFVLVLAWGLGIVVADVQTAEFLAGALKAGIPVSLLPTIITLLCFVTSYACGSTFGTMGIIFPLVGPLAWTLGGGDEQVLLHCFASILGGSIFGNICSPISDTTILTSSSTGCSLASHVATTTPYTVTIGLMAILIGNMPVGYGLYDAPQAVVLGTCLIVTVVQVFGRSVPATPVITGAQ